jgi:repressor LexA
MNGLTQRQKECLKAIKTIARTNGYPASVREISDALGGISTNAVSGHLVALEAKGYIKRNPAIARSIQILQPA